MTEVESVYSAVRAKSLYKTERFIFEGLVWHMIVQHS
jgi:hypothetical protein